MNRRQGGIYVTVADSHTSGDLTKADEFYSNSNTKLRINIFYYGFTEGGTGGDLIRLKFTK